MKTTVKAIIVVLILVISCVSIISFTNSSFKAVLIPNKLISLDKSKLDLDSKGRLIFEGKMFSGYVIKKNLNNDIIEKKGYLNGYLEGKSEGYFDNGKLKFKRYYRSGKKVGTHKGWYINGQKKFQYFFNIGLSEETHYQWYENGQLYSEINYSNGKPFGATKIWRKDGKLRSNFIIRENGRRYGLAGIKRCTKINIKDEIIDPYVVIR